MNEEAIPKEVVELVRKHGKDLRLYFAITAKYFDFIQAMTPAQAEVFISEKKAAVS